MTTDENPERQPVSKGWQVGPVPGCPAHEDDDGNIRIPILLGRDGRHVADTEMVLLLSEAQSLSDRLTDAAVGRSRSVLRELFHGHVIAEGSGVTVVSKLGHSG